MADGQEGGEVVVDEVADVLGQIETVLAEADKLEGKPADAVAALAKEEPAAVAEKAPVAEVAKSGEIAQVPDPAAERTLSRLVAREEALAKRESDIADAEKRNRGLVSQFRRNPVEALKAIGVPDDEIPQVIRASMATQLAPEKVPQQYKQIQERLVQEDRFRTQEAELAALRAELQQKDSVAAEKAAVAQYENETRTYLNGAETDAPNLAKLYKAKPELALRRVFDVVQTDARTKLARAGKGDEVGPMTPAEAAKAVEAELAEYVVMLGVTTGDSTTQATNAAKAKPSLSNRAAQPTGIRPGTGANKIEEFDAQAEVDNWMKSVGL